MKYMMLVCVEDAAAFEEDARRERAEAAAAAAAGTPKDPAESAFPWLTEMIGRGVRLDGNRLGPVSEATTVRVRGGEVLLSDGPFAETKEAIIGYDVLDCKDLDEAVEVASKHPAAPWGLIELRPFWE